MLEPKGRLAGYVIHTPDGLTPAQQLRAADLGPSDVSAPAGPEELTRRAGFVIRRAEDVTTDFRATCLALLRAREEHAEQLRVEEGEEVFEEEWGRKARMLEGIDAGLLRRSLVVAVRP